MDPAPETRDAAPLPQIPEPDYGRRRTSKIGRLPKLVRDSINLMLLDGVPHAEIPKRLGQVACHITQDNIDKWAVGSYPLWLAEFQHLQETRVQHEVAMDLACQDGDSRIHEATLQLAATSLAQMLRDLDLTDFKELLRDDPAKLIPLLTSLATISNAEIKCERHRLDLEDRRARLQKNQNPDKAAGLRPETRRKMENDLNLM